MREQLSLSEPVQLAIAELRDLIAQRFPAATFAIRQGIDDPEQTFLVTTVDIEDPDAVMDLVIERLLAFKFDQGIGVNVVPVHTPERIAETRRRSIALQTRARHGVQTPLPPG